mgnify:CR=1 FL=1
MTISRIWCLLDLHDWLVHYDIVLHFHIQAIPRARTCLRCLCEQSLKLAAEPEKK